ncbi:hypothetical protein PN836_001055 [Ningiella sp. W23]|uniref:hypothetical protein n=1 Tax=Ningiella sp. W23 TaxID=3023715 RepID=UPI003757212B
MKLIKKLTLSTLLLAGISFSTQAAIIGGVEFPDGAASFADKVVSFTPGDPSATSPYSNPENAIGIPDFDAASTSCTDTDCEYVSLGRGGSIVLEFVDNLLTGSNNSDLDLWVFEIGPDVEDTFVDVSADGLVWTSVGKVFGATSGIDLDAFGFDASSLLRFVRLTDDPDEGDLTGLTVGADIDAVGAISTILVPPTDVNAPSIAILIGLMMTGLIARRKS